MKSAVLCAFMSHSFVVVSFEIPSVNMLFEGNLQIGWLLPDIGVRSNCTQLEL